VDNEHSWLAFTDLVFIDPVTTGYSRPAVGEKPEQFHGVQEDIESVGEFIRLYTTRYARWSSPKFLAGESYGTTRAAGLSGYLQDRFGMYLNGIVLISTILNFQTTDFNVGNDLPYVLFLPSYTSNAVPHASRISSPARSRRRSRNRRSSRQRIQPALTRIAPGLERQAVVKKLARLTGLRVHRVQRPARLSSASPRSSCATTAERSGARTAASRDRPDAGGSGLTSTRATPRSTVPTRR
jgi:carboxypeptidase C (cathepsin A)